MKYQRITETETGLMECLSGCLYTNAVSHRYGLTTSKPMGFRSVYTQLFSYCFRHAEVITGQRGLGKIKEKKESQESITLILSAWRKVCPNSPGVTKELTFYKVSGLWL